MTKKTKITPEVLKQLEAEGYKVTKRANWERKTFVVESEVLQAFIDARAKYKVKLQDAATEALRDWTAKKKAGK
jgi:hypothetical protein